MKSQIQGYEDVNDHETLRYDPVFQLVLGKICEGEPSGIDYVFGLATNVRLRRGATDVIEKAIAEYDQRLIPVVSFLEKQFHPSSL